MTPSHPKIAELITEKMYLLSVLKKAIENNWPQLAKETQKLIDENDRRLKEMYPNF